VQRFDQQSFHGGNGVSTPNTIPERWRRAASFLLWGAAIFSTAVVVLRVPRAENALPAWWILAASIVTGGLAFGAMSVHPVIERELSARGGLLAVSLVSLTALATTGNGPFELALALVIATASLGTAVIREAMRQEMAGKQDVVEASLNPPVVDGDEGEIDDAEAESLPEHVVQTTTRYSLDGADCLEACVRLHFGPGQQSATVHVPIQPAMPAVPEVHCELTAGESIRVSSDPVQPYGVRIVGRRSGSLEGETDAVVAVLIQSRASASAAA
jgi:hypothetical protein